MQVTSNLEHKLHKIPTLKCLDDNVDAVGQSRQAMPNYVWVVNSFIAYKRCELY